MTFENGYEIVANTNRGRLCAYVKPGEPLKGMMERLLNDDPMWRKPRIRAMEKNRVEFYQDFESCGSLVLRYESNQ